MQSVVAVCEREAEKQGFSRVVEICLRIGELSGVVPECLTEFFPVAARDTVAERAKLRMEAIPARISCPDCGYEGPPKGCDCPGCGGAGYKLTGGREFYIESLEVE